MLTGQTTRQPFHLMAKPSGAACNLDCTYCFYLEKQAIYPTSSQRMSDEILEAYTREYLAAHPVDQPVIFTWQGGEPTLMGLDFYQRAIQWQQHYGRSRQIQNTFQTNGVLLDDQWCRFLAEHHFLVGLSLDGPAEIHDRYRTDKSGKPTHARVMAALRLLQQHRVDYNILACVNRLSSQHPLEVYQFLRQQGAQFVQFTPVIERPSQGHYAELGLSLSGPASRIAGSLAPPQRRRRNHWSPTGPFCPKTTADSFAASLPNGFARTSDRCSS